MARMKTKDLPETRGKVFLIDIDGTLCTGNAYTPEECLNAKPISEVIAKVNEIWHREFVVIYTAREDDLIPATLEWLRINKVRFHAISNNKIPGILVDDRAITINQFLKINV